MDGYLLLSGRGGGETVWEYTTSRRSVDNPTVRQLADLVWLDYEYAIDRNNEQSCVYFAELRLAVYGSRDYGWKG